MEIPIEVESILTLGIFRTIQEQLDWLERAKERIENDQLDRAQRAFDIAHGELFSVEKSVEFLKEIEGYSSVVGDQLQKVQDRFEYVRNLLSESRKEAGADCANQ